MAPRTSFQVAWSSITAFGNMQASQQMWRMVLVSSPFSSRSQKPACLTTSRRPFGSSTRQWRPVFSWSPEPKTVPSFWATWKSRVQGRSASATWR